MRARQLDPYYALAQAAHAAYLNSLVGDPVPIVKQYHEWSKDPQVGDIVYESSTIYFPYPPNGEQTPSRRYWNRAAIGRLVWHGRLPMMSEEHWRESGAEECMGMPNAPYDLAPHDTYWFIVPLDPTVKMEQVAPDGTRSARWENCSFIRVPHNLQIVPK